MNKILFILLQLYIFSVYFNYKISIKLHEQALICIIGIFDNFSPYF